jgi:hypothetical protein
VTDKLKDQITSHLRAGQQTELEGEDRELFLKGRAAIAKWAEKLDHPDHPDCTGIGASYCEIHGACTCAPEGGAGACDPECPLHGDDIPRPHRCDVCGSRASDDERDLSYVRFRRVLCEGCFGDVRRRGGRLPRGLSEPTTG